MDIPKFGQGGEAGMSDIRDVPGLWCDDITFCQERCGWKSCPRNSENIRDRTVPHSFSVEIPQDCPKKHNCGVTMARNALAMLENQEPVDMEIEGGGNSWWYVCEECRGSVDTSDRFCRHCGRPFRNRKCAGCKDDCPQTGNFVCPNGKL